MSPRLALLAAVGLLLWAPAAPAQAPPTHAAPTSPARPAAHRAPARRLPDLAVRTLPPTTLSMRGPRVAQGSPPQPPQPSTAAPDDNSAQLPEPLTRLRRQLRQQAAMLPEQLRTVADMTVFRMSLGLGLDGGQPSRDLRLDGQMLRTSDYERLRIYYFGDAVLGSRGLIAPGLTTYFATRFRFDHDPPPGTKSSPVPSAYDPIGEEGWQERMMVRSAYGQTDGLFGLRRLKPVYLRFGRQYRYGPAIVHFDGLTLGYTGPALSVDTFVGVGADPYGYIAVPVRGEEPGSLATSYSYQTSPPSSSARQGIAGLQMRLDLHKLRGLPLVLNLDTLQAGTHSHAQLGAALRWSEDILLSGSLRWLDGEAARQRFDLHARLSKVTSVVAAVDRRTEHDWMYDLFTFGRQRRDSADASSHYLELYLPQRRTYFDLRAGTVLLGNVDVLVRGTAAISKDEPDSSSSYALDYAEAGTGFEVRLRRTWSVSASVLGRSYNREDTDPMFEQCASPIPNPMPIPECADPLPSLASTGETSFFEGSITSHLTLGARSFSADIELYGRDYDLVQVYRELDEDELDDLERRGGLRFAAEGWPNKRLRLRAEYDVSFALPTIPELRGIKSLRIMAEGQF